MAEEVHVFFAGNVPSRTRLSAALRRLGWPFVIERMETRLSDQSGYLPMTLRGEETGAELFFSAVDDDARQFVPDLDPLMNRIAHLRWGGSELEMAAALCLAAALADLTQGLIFEEAGGRSLNAAEAIPWAGQHFAAIKPVNNGLGAREADLRRHLRPLLGPSVLKPRHLTCFQPARAKALKASGDSVVLVCGAGPSSVGETPYRLSCSRYSP